MVFGELRPPLGLITFTGMSTWSRGRDLLFACLRKEGLELPSFIESVERHAMHRVARTAVYRVADPSEVPQAAAMTEPKEPVEFHAADLLEAAATLYLVQEDRGQAASEQTRQAYGQLRDANLLATGVLASVLLRVQPRFAARTSQSEQRDALYASFVIGMDPCERAIEEARYLQALTLLRHEMQTLAQLQAVQHGTRGRTCESSLRALEPSMKRLYGKLSDAVHMRVRAMLRHATRSLHTLRDAPGPAVAACYFPMFDRELARRSFGLHIYLTLRLLEAIGADLRHGPVVSKQELQAAVNRAVELLVSEGVLDRRDAGRLSHYRPC